ncbi:hypothetical protein [Amycolatopsis sp. H20-H5]|uniref:hypothetical protein n=1 Tax=Amycolatopsis sp. H20-H5 TaxID=3046309 RepID=UPI002DC032E4|nr:hypothetical protein [Amycolatopsis sp. H20-H5]MEC3982467.1 hypothetical protein [Amycolatopsis sp. H20-H5]
MTDWEPRLHRGDDLVHLYRSEDLADPGRFWFVPASTEDSPETTRHLSEDIEFDDPAEGQECERCRRVGEC